MAKALVLLILLSSLSATADADVRRKIRVGTRIPGATANDIFFAGANGILSRDSAGFYYDPATDKLTLGGDFTSTGNNFLIDSSSSPSWILDRGNSSTNNAYVIYKTAGSTIMGTGLKGGVGDLPSSWVVVDSQNRLMIQVTDAGTVGDLTVTGAINANDWTDVSITESQVSDLSHTTDTSANTECSGTTTYLDGEGNCDDISGTYLTGNETITLSGDVSGSGETAITATVADDSHNHVYSNVDQTTSANWASQVSDETGTGVWVFSDTPTISSLSVDSSAVTYGGDARPQRSFYVDASGMWPSTTSGAAAPAKVEFTTNDIDMIEIQFGNASNTHAQFSFVAPKSWDGTTFKFIPYWFASSGTAAQTALFDIQAIGYGDGDALDTAWGTAQRSTGTYASANFREQGTEVEVTPAGSAVGEELIQVRITRIVSDTLTSTVRFLGVMVKWTATTESDD